MGRKMPGLCSSAIKEEASIKRACLRVAEGGLVLPALPLKLLLMGPASVLQPGSRRAMLQPAGAPAHGHQNAGVLLHASCHCYYNGQ